MPPFNPIDNKPAPPPLQMQSGLDQQTKNVILFAVIFSMLAIGVGLYFFIKPERNPATATSRATTTASSVSVSAGSKSFFSFFDFFSPTFSLPSIVPTNMFAIPSSGNQHTSTNGNQNSAPYITDGTEQNSGNAALTAEEQRTQYLKTLEGIYGETAATEEQLKQIQLTIISSPLRGKIWISSVQRATDPNQEYVILSTNDTLPKETPITGMTLKSLASGQVVQIGKGVYLPLMNAQNIEEEIKIYPGQQIIVATTRSPLGYSFRLNKCTGYFEQFQDFTPSVPQACPRLENEPLPQVPNQLSDKCLDYIQQFPQCQIVTDTLSSAVDAQTNACHLFVLDHTGYQNCVTLHKYDSNFYDSNWRTYLNRTMTLWKQKREIIWLLDQNGRFISQYSY